MPNSIAYRRNVHFLTGLEDAGVEFVCCDMEGATRTTVRLMAVIAEAERDMIKARTKAALAEKKKKLAALTDAEKAELKSQGRATSLGGYRGKGALTPERQCNGA